MQDIGNVLRSAREKKQIGLEQIARETNIARRYLEALETGMYEVFPGEPYVIGFLRNYAEYLGLNQDECVLLYRQAKIQETAIPPEKLIPQRSLIIPRTVFVLLGSVPVLVVLLFVMHVVWEKIKIGGAGADPSSKEAGQAQVIEKKEHATYTLSKEIFEKRVFVGDTISVPIDGTDHYIRIEKTAPELHLKTDIGTQIIALGQSIVLDLNGDVAGDVRISVEDLDKFDESKGALIEAVIAETSTAADIKVPEPSVQPETAKYKVLFDAGSAYPVTLNATFRSYCLFRYEQDKTNRDERYYQKSEQLTIQANNRIRVWASNGNAVKMQIIAGGKTIDIEVSRPGEVSVKDFKWLKDDESGRYKFVVMEVD